MSRKITRKPSKSFNVLKFLDFTESVTKCQQRVLVEDSLMWLWDIHTTSLVPFAFFPEWKLNHAVQQGTRMLQMTVLLLLFSNCIAELCVPLHLPEIKLLDVSKNKVENVSSDFLTGCPKLETLNISMNNICEYSSKWLNAGTTYYIFFKTDFPPSHIRIRL